MTEGRPLKLILTFTFPVLCGDLFQIFYHIADSVIVGRYLGVDALAAVGSTSALVFVIVYWIVGMTNGFGILLSQAYGAKDEYRLKHYTAMSFYLCAAMAVIMTAVLLIANHPLLRIMNIPDSIFTDTSNYVAVIYAGLPATALYNMMASIARAFGDSKTPLYFLILSSVLNVVLDLLFVAVLPFKVEGAAYATVLAQVVSAVLCTGFVWKKYEIIHFGKEERAFSQITMKKLLTIGTPMALQYSVTGIGAMIVQSALNQLGAKYIAAHSAAMKVQNVVVQAYASMGVALATYVGQNYGAGKIERIKQGVKKCMMAVAVYSAIIMFIGYFILPLCIPLFVDDPTGEIKEIAAQVFHITLWFYFVQGAIFVYRNALQGLGNGMIPMLGGICEMAARVLVIVFLFGPFQFTAICLGDPAAWMAAIIPLVPYYYWYMNKVM